MAGLALEVSLTWGISSLELRQIMEVGDSAIESIGTRGYQYQYCENMAIPMMDDMRLCPEGACKLIVELQPPAFRMPIARMHPNLVMVSSCLSATILSVASLSSFTLGS